jgi:hypothetical protein
VVRASSPPTLALTDVGHTLDGATLVVTGWVTNRGRDPLARLVVDVQGFAPSGELVTFGSDGIPWAILPDGAERFSVSLAVPPSLIRDYAVTVAPAQPLGRPLVELRRHVEVALYRSLVLSRVRLAADVQIGRLILRTDVGGMPVAQLTVEATLLLFNPNVNLLQHLTVLLPPDRTEMFAIGGTHATLLCLRIVGLVLKTAWD